MDAETTSRIAELERQVKTLQLHTRIDTFLNRMKGEGGLSALVQAASTLTGKSVVLFDFSGRRIASAAPEFPQSVRIPELREIMAACAPTDTRQHAPIVVSAGPTTGMARRKLLTSIEAASEHFGWLVIDEHPSRFLAVDEYVARRVADRIGAEFLTQRRIAHVAWNARISLARQMLRGTLAAEDLQASGEYLGVNTSSHYVIAYVRVHGENVADVVNEEKLAQDLSDAMSTDVLTARGSEGLALLVQVADHQDAQMNFTDQVKTAILSALEKQIGTSKAHVGISKSTDVAGMPRAYREAREVAISLDRFADGTSSRVLGVEDLGPARLFLANADGQSMQNFVSEVLGPILTNESSSADLLVTLQTFFDSARSVRLTSKALGLHENTIRLRLSRIELATGLDLASNPNDQLSVQIALMILRVQNHSSLPAVGLHGNVADIDRRLA